MLFRLESRILYLLLLIVSNVAGQNFNDYGNATDVFYRNYSLINPAVGGSSSPVEVCLNYKSLTGVFSQVRTFYASSNFRIAEKANKDSSHNKHIAGIMLFGDKEGDFFGRTRAYANYAYHIGLRKNLFLSAGISAGLVSYAYKSSTASAGGSANGLTGNIGLWLYNEKMHLGVSSIDIPNVKLNPIGTPVLLSRFYTFTFDYKLPFNRSLSIVPQAELLVYGKKYNRVNAGAYLLLQNSISAGILYKLYQGYVFTIGFENVKIFQGKTNFFFSYKVPTTSATQLAVSSFEIVMSYQLSNFKKMIMEEIESPAEGSDEE
jgi:type IX secretion system PorP/SprF family membrane protein